MYKYWVRIKWGASFEPNIGQDPYSTTFVCFFTLLLLRKVLGMEQRESKSRLTNTGYMIKIWNFLVVVGGQTFFNFFFKDNCKISIYRECVAQFSDLFIFVQRCKEGETLSRFSFSFLSVLFFRTTICVAQFQNISFVIFYLLKTFS